MSANGRLRRQRGMARRRGQSKKTPVLKTPKYCGLKDLRCWEGNTRVLNMFFETPGVRCCQHRSF